LNRRVLKLDSPQTNCFKYISDRKRSPSTNPKLDSYSVTFQIPREFNRSINVLTRSCERFRVSRTWPLQISKFGFCYLQNIWRMMQAWPNNPDAQRSCTRFLHKVTGSGKIWQDRLT